MSDLSRYAGDELQLEAKTLTLGFGAGVTTPPVTARDLDEIRPMLQDPQASGSVHLSTIDTDVKAPGVTDALGARGAALAQDESRLDLVSRPEAFPALWERLTRGS